MGAGLARIFASAEGANRVLQEFRAATPRLQADPRFRYGIAIDTDEGRYVPYVYLAQDPPSGIGGRPGRCVLVWEVAPEMYRVAMVGMFVILGGRQTTCLPENTPKSGLGEAIIGVWENYLGTIEEIRHRIHQLAPTDP